MERSNQAGEGKTWRFRMVTLVEIEELDEIPGGFMGTVHRQETDPGWIPMDQEAATRILRRGGFQRLDSRSPISTESSETLSSPTPKNE